MRGTVSLPANRDPEVLERLHPDHFKNMCNRMEVHLNASATIVGNDQARITGRMKEVGIYIIWSALCAPPPLKINWFSWFSSKLFDDLGGLRGNQSVQLIYGETEALLNICRTIFKASSCNATVESLQYTAQSKYRKHGYFEQHAWYRRSTTAILMENNRWLNENGMPKR